MRKLAFLTIVALMINCIPYAALADSLTFNVASVTANAGETVDVPVLISNNPGIAAFILRLNYDNTKLEPVSISKGAAIDFITSNIQTGGDLSQLSYVTAVWFSTEDITADRVLFSVRFKVKAGAKGSIPLTLTCKNNDISNSQSEAVSFILENGSINVIGSETPVDTTGDNQNASGASSSGSPVVSPSPSPEVYPLLPNEAASDNLFTDLAGFDWAVTEINTLAHKGIIKGTSAAMFSPANNIKRADFMILLVRMLGLDDEITDNFDDVPPDAYYYNEIGTAKALGLTNGVGDNLFDPESSISRQDMFTLTYRIMETQGRVEAGDTEALKQFSDNADAAGYAIDALAALVEAGLVKGDGNTLNPLGNATRAETAVFMWRVMELMGNN